MNINHVGNGQVVLVAGGGQCYTDIAARFVGSDRSVDDILQSPSCPAIVRNILGSGHLAATEFDFFIFGVSGYSRITEVQLVRKRLASYMFSSGRATHRQRQVYSVALPDEICDFTFVDSHGRTSNINEYLINGELLYNQMLDAGISEENARYIKPQATTFKGLIGMNAHALHDWFKIRCCFRAQLEIRDMATKMMQLCREVQPDLFKDSGASCRVLGYCPENDRQCTQMRGIMPTHDQVLTALHDPTTRSKILGREE